LFLSFFLLMLLLLLLMTGYKGVAIVSLLFPVHRHRAGGRAATSPLGRALTHTHTLPHVAAAAAAVRSFSRSLPAAYYCQPSPSPSVDPRQKILILLLRTYR